MTDCEAIRNRLEFAGDALGISWAEIEPLVKASDRELMHSPRGAATDVVAFAVRHGLSLDWLVYGDLRGVLTYAAAHLRRAGSDG